MLILVVEPQKAPVVKEISDDLHQMQKLVDGFIEVLYPFEDEVALVCNEEGKLMNLPSNRGLWDEHGDLYKIICGTFFLCGAPSDSDSFTSLTPEQVETLKHRFASPEIFIGMDGHIVCLPVDEATFA